jgi:hypothetical protein
MFTCQEDKGKLLKRLYYDIPFAYSPFWDRIQKESERRANALGIKREGYIPIPRR